MYAKTLIPGPQVDVPGLLVTTSSDQALRDLRAHGWGELGDDPPKLTTSVVRLGTPGLQLVVNGMAILDDDTNPVAPPGWWEAIDAIKSALGAPLVGVQVVRCADVPDDFHDPALVDALKSVFASRAGVSALVRVTEWL